MSASSFASMIGCSCVALVLTTIFFASNLFGSGNPVLWVIINPSSTSSMITGFHMYLSLFRLLRVATNVLDVHLFHLLRKTIPDNRSVTYLVNMVKKYQFNSYVYSSVITIHSTCERSLVGGFSFTAPPCKKNGRKAPRHRCKPCFQGGNMLP